jgi:hypothetical protein
MDESTAPGKAPPERKSRLGLAVVLTALITLCLAGAVLVLARDMVGPLIWSPTATSAAAPVSSPTPSPTPVAIVENVQALGQLVTIQYSIQAVLEETRERGDFWDWLTRERLLLVAYGEVIAGVNLAEVTAGDISVEDEQVTIRLPQSIIISQRVDMDRTYVYDYERGFIGDLIPPDPNWVIQVESRAESVIVERAVADGILDKAAANAQVQLTALMYSLGFKKVEFVVTAP